MVSSRDGFALRLLNCLAGYIVASLDLAYEYVTLGKLKRAASIFKPVLEVVREHKASLDVSVRLLLRFAETLAILEDVPRR